MKLAELVVFYAVFSNLPMKATLQASASKISSDGGFLNVLKYAEAGI